jgi:Holliday junction resolvase
MQESLIQSKIIKALQGKGWIVIRLRSTSESGWPDLLALRNGRAVFLEVKDPKGKTSDLQSYKHIMLRMEKFEVYTVDNTKILRELKLT